MKLFLNHCAVAARCASTSQNSSLSRFVKVTGAPEPKLSNTITLICIATKNPIHSTTSETYRVFHYCQVWSVVLITERERRVRLHCVSSNLRGLKSQHTFNPPASGLESNFPSILKWKSQQLSSAERSE